ncbi:MAG: SDR family NAD(P)-dependent oxidoreductase, partial [Desulfobacteraceae bacterium]|nr:SDR family NAD(P)-dependent oxidoreductase [Desulfobacteraceae bacterium]
MAVSNKFCLVTGASSGIGKYIAYEMVHRGWKVIAIARRSDKLEELAKHLGEDKLIPLVCDVSNFDQVKEASAELMNRELYPSLFFLNAGDGDEEDDTGLDREFHKRIFEVNYFGAISWVSQWIPVLKEKGGGTFVGTSSLQSFVAMPGATAYGSSKSALNYSFRSLDAMYHKNNIRFALVYPGPVDTAMLKTDTPLPGTWKPEKAARYIVKKVLKGSTRIKFPPRWVLLTGIGKRLPDRVFRMK